MKHDRDKEKQRLRGGQDSEQQRRPGSCGEDTLSEMTEPKPGPQSSHQGPQITSSQLRSSEPEWETSPPSVTGRWTIAGLRPGGQILPKAGIARR